MSDTAQDTPDQPSRKPHRRHREKKLKFERHASQVVYDPGAGSYVVTWAKCDRPIEERLSQRKDLARWRPSVVAVATLYDRGKIDESHVMAAAKSISESWRLGDREFLDSEGCKKAAELVSDLANINGDGVGTKDIMLAIRNLLDEVAKVRFQDEPIESFSDDSILRALSRAAGECLSIDGFMSWSPISKRRRFLYCLNKRERNRVSYTLISMLFDNGACPLLSSADRRTIRTIASEKSGMSEKVDQSTVDGFFSVALGMMNDAKSRGESQIRESLTQQQLSDSITSHAGS